MDVDELIALIYRKDYAALREAKLNGEDFNATDNEGRTLLMHAVLAADAEAEMIDFLLKCGANPNIKDIAQHWSALHFAARDQKLSIAKLLLIAGAEIDSEDSFGNTPLWRCVMAPNPNHALIKELICNGANPNKKNFHDISPIDIAKTKGKSGLLELLMNTI